MKIQLSTNSINTNYGLNFKQKERQAQTNKLATTSCANTDVIHKNYALSAMLIKQNPLNKPVSFGSGYKYKPMNEEEFLEKKPEINEKIKQKNVYAFLNKFNILFAEKYFKHNELNENKNVTSFLSNILNYTNEIEGLNNRMATTDYLLSKEDYLKEEDISKNLGEIIFMSLPPKEIDERLDFFKALKKDERIKNKTLYRSFTEELKFTSSKKELEIAEFVLSQDEKEIESKIDFVKQEIYKDFKNKCGDTEYAKQNAKNKIAFLLDEDNKFLLLTSCIYDKETLAHMYNKGINELAKQYNTLERMSLPEIKLFMQFCNCHDENGNKFNPEQKITFAKYIVDNDLSNSDKFKNMVETDSLELRPFNIKLLQKTLNTMFFNDMETAVEKSKLLDLDYASELNKSLHEQDNKSIKKLLSLAFANQFDEYISNEKTDVGLANKKTKEMFKKHYMDYDFWLHPTKDLERVFKATDTNTEKLSQISASITEDMNNLLNSPAKNLIKKQFEKYIKDDKFVLPEKMSNSKNELEKLLNILSDTSSQGQLTQVWKRASINKTSENINTVKNATNILTILDHFNTLSKEIANVNETIGKKELDITIKMWDRNPLKDIFQGNYSTCCIGMGNINAGCMADYLMTNAFNMIELVDNKTNKIIGNSLCYFITDENDKPALVLDNIEINNKEKPSTEVGKKLRAELFEYASSIAEKVTGRKNIPILLGKMANDLPTNDLKGSKNESKFLGDYASKLIYLDAFGGFCSRYDINDDIFLFRCNGERRI